MNDLAANLFQQGMEFKNSNKYDDAISSFNEALKKGYDPKHIYFLLGLTYEQKNKDTDALENFYKTLELSSDSIGPRIMIYDIYMKKGEIQKALNIIDEILDINPKYFLAYKLRFELLLSLQYYNECSNVINNVKKNLGVCDYTYLWESILLWKNCNYSEALNIINEGEKNSQIKDLFTIEKAKVYALTNKVDESISILEEVYNNHIGNLELLYYLGFLNINKRNYKAAKVYLEVLWQSNEYNNNFYLVGCYYYGVALKEENSEFWVKYMERLLSKYKTLNLKRPDDLNLLFLMVLVNKELSKFNTSLELLDYISETYGDTGEIHFMKGIIYFEDNKLEESEAEFKLFNKMGGAIKNLFLKHINLGR